MRREWRRTSRRPSWWGRKELPKAAPDQPAALMAATAAAPAFQPAFGHRSLAIPDATLLKLRRQRLGEHHLHPDRSRFAALRIIAQRQFDKPDHGLPRRFL